MNFPDTNWTLLARAKLGGDTSCSTALGVLLEAYRVPVVSFLRHRCYTSEDASDLVHELFLELIQSQAWRRADQAKGRFRSFLLGILTHVLSREHRSNEAEKRGKGRRNLSLDELAAEGFDLAAPSSRDIEYFDRQWALGLVANALAAVELQFSEKSRQSQWAVLVLFLPGAGEAPTYEAAAADLTMTLPALKTAVNRVRQKFRDAVHLAVSRTVNSPTEVDDELAYLHRVLSAHSG